MSKMEGDIMSKMKELFELKENGKCPFCGKDMENAEFRDENALKEFKISGLCQKCQDEFFGV